MTKFIFMLTKRDVTVPDAVRVFEEVKDSGVKCVGFKDIGLPDGELSRLVKLMRSERMEIFLEVVSESQVEALRSARKALQLKVDYLIGGTYVESTLPLLKGQRIKYFPYVGRVVGHPCVLEGSIEEIIGDVRRFEQLGVDGINLLAYRWDGNVRSLMHNVVSSSTLPIVVAGSIDSLERVGAVKTAGAWAFTIGGAVFDRKFHPKGSLKDQIATVLGAV